jgi:S-adenosylmethionine synthetase
MTTSRIAARSHLFTSESVTEGHPDKVADQISDTVLDQLLADDPDARVACETLVTRDLVVIAGEVTSAAPAARDADALAADVERVARETISRIGYTLPGTGFAAQDARVLVRLSPQSPDIARGVDHAADGATTGAGDQGHMFGYATDDTPRLMPLPITLAHEIARRLAALRHDGTLPWLRPDGKSQVTVRYADGVPVGVERVLVSTQHSDDVPADTIFEAISEAVVTPVLDAHGLRCRDDQLLVNPTGRFVEGGPSADCGLTGRKIIVDTYGGMGRHGGGAFSGKDATKVDRSGAYAARWLAKNIVAAGLATRCEVQLAYAIGVAQPVSVYIDTFGTGTRNDEAIERAVTHCVDLRPAAIIERLMLARPIYEPTAAYGHFGRDEREFTWESTGLADELRETLGSTTSGSRAVVGDRKQLVDVPVERPDPRIGVDQ